MIKFNILTKNNNYMCTKYNIPHDFCFCYWNCRYHTILLTYII